MTNYVEPLAGRTLDVWTDPARRSTHADWCLAHPVGSAAEQAYARSDLLERRRQLMEACAQYVGGDRA